ncbi:MAG: hypothetical protein ACRDZ2_08350, partial [Ilumatobacteraceae bacterium]
MSKAQQRGIGTRLKQSFNSSGVGSPGFRSIDSSRGSTSGTGPGTVPGPQAEKASTAHAAPVSLAYLLFDMGSSVPIPLWGSRRKMDLAT